MAPKAKVTKEAILSAALALVQSKGVAALNVRGVAAALGCSTQPVFSNFANMEELRQAVAQRATQLYEKHLARERASGAHPPYKAGGMAYIRFAKEEKELFKFLYMCDRAGEGVPYENRSFDEMVDTLHQNLGFSQEKAQLFHLEMWAFVHGIAVMFATNFLDLDWQLVSQMLTDMFLGLKKQYGEAD